MKTADFETVLDETCRQEWNAALAELTPEEQAVFQEEWTIEDAKEEVRMNIQALITLGLLKERIEP